MTTKLDPATIPCKFDHTFYGWVPVPFGSGNCSMPGWECTYEGDKEIPEDQTECTPACPAYEPLPIEICPKHDREYIGVCMDCENELEARQDAAEAEYERIANEMRAED